MKLLLRPFCILTLLLVAACNGGESTTNVYTNTKQSGVDTLAKTDRGKQIFEQRCVVCHGEYGNLRNENAANLQISRIDSGSIVYTINNGRGRMPMFSGAINDTDMAHLVAYVKSLRK